jgi:hypothetical protein
MTKPTADVSVDLDPVDTGLGCVAGQHARDGDGPLTLRDVRAPWVHLQGLDFPRRAAGSVVKAATQSSRPCRTISVPPAASRDSLSTLWVWRWLDAKHLRLPPRSQ